MLADSVAGELISSEIEIRSGRGEDFADAVDRQRERRRRLFALAADAGAGARRDGRPSVEPLAGPADHRHAALPARRGGAEVRRLAQQHLQRPHPRRASGARSAPSRCVTRCGRCCRRCSRPPRTPRSSRASSAGCTRPAPRSSRACSRAAGCPTTSAAGTRTATTSTSSSASGSIIEHTQIWWSVRPHLSFGTVELRIMDCQSSAEESTALLALAAACIAQAALDFDAGRRPEPVPARLIEENFWRAIRYGLDGRLIDFERLERDPRSCCGRAPARVDRAGARGASARLRTSRALERMLDSGQRGAAPVATARGRRRAAPDLRRDSGRDLCDLCRDARGRRSMREGRQPREPRQSHAEQPSEEELRAQLEEELRRITVSDVLLQTVVSLVNLGGQRLGLARGRRATCGTSIRSAWRSRACARCCRWSSRRTPEQVAPIREALAQLQMVYAREVGGGAGRPPGGAARPTAARSRRRPPGRGPRTGAPGGLWVPPGSDK